HSNQAAVAEAESRGLALGVDVGSGAGGKAESELFWVQEPVSGPKSPTDDVGANVRKSTSNLVSGQVLGVCEIPRALPGHQIGLTPRVVGIGGEPEVARLPDVQVVLTLFGDLL